MLSSLQINTLQGFHKKEKHAHIQTQKRDSEICLLSISILVKETFGETFVWSTLTKKIFDFVKKIFRNIWER